MLWKLYHVDKNMAETTKKIEKETEGMSEYKTSLSTLDEDFKTHKKQHGKLMKAFLKVDKKWKDKERVLSEYTPRQLSHEEKVKFTHQKRVDLMSSLDTSQISRVQKVKELEKVCLETNAVKKAFASFTAQSQKNKHVTLSESALKEYETLKIQFSQKTSDELEKLDRLTRDQNVREEAQARVQETIDSTNTKLEQLGDEKSALESRQHKVIIAL